MVSSSETRDAPEVLAKMHGIHFDHTIPAREAMCRHRLRIVDRWGIKPGDNILEVGCGHGEMSLALASSVGDSGHLTGVDNAPPTYGAPLTVGEAQAALKRAKIGHRMDFHLNSTVDTFLADRRQSPRKQLSYNIAAFSHSLFYFRSREELLQVFKSLWEKTPTNMRLCLAEWGLVSSHMEGLPHVHAVLTQQQLEFYKTSSLNNLRTLMSPASLKELAWQAGWAIKDEGFFETAADVQDGRLEVGVVLSSRWWGEVEKKCKELEMGHPGILHHIRQYWEALDMATDTVGMSNVRCMDTYYAVFTKRGSQGGELEPPPRKRVVVSASTTVPPIERALTNAPRRNETRTRPVGRPRKISTANGNSSPASREPSKTPSRVTRSAGLSPTTPFTGPMRSRTSEILSAKSPPKRRSLRSADEPSPSFADASSNGVLDSEEEEGSETVAEGSPRRSSRISLIASTSKEPESPRRSSRQGVPSQRLLTAASLSPSMEDTPEFEESPAPEEMYDVDQPSPKRPRLASP